MNGKMMTVTFFEFYTVYVKKSRTILFPYLFINFFKEISFVKS